MQVWSANAIHPVWEHHATCMPTEQPTYNKRSPYFIIIVVVVVIVIIMG